MDRFQQQALACLYWHRLMSTDQVRLLIGSATPLRTVQYKLRCLHREQLIDGVHGHHAPRAWHVTEEGARLVEAAGLVDSRPYRVPSRAVLKLLRGHALDVVETGLAFVETARAHGHDCGPLSWTPEVAHHLQHQRSRDAVIADAVLHYVAEADGRRAQHTYFIELDRATMPVARLAQKLRAYVRYHDFAPPRSAKPVWRQRYPKFPKCLVVLSGAAEHVLERRLLDLRAHARAMPDLEFAGDRVTVLGTLLHRLADEGPLAPIAWPILGDADQPVPVIPPVRSA
ncbi:replication-relaxation family protein [Amycolatopsis magusensis]|uniref:replication-relaxation family protein n=1 Tax=Amycolatopsis magusensis TaxID=882444 RepID=UPI0037892976